MTKREIEDLTFEIIGAGITVHKEIGRGLFESAYHKCLKAELKFRNLKFVSECSVPLIYKGVELETEFKCDLLIEDSIVLELKAAKENREIWTAQLLTYMKLLKCPKGILINFNSYNLYRQGTSTYVNEFFKMLPDS